MKRAITLASLAIVGLLAVALYLLENEVEHMRRRLAQLDAEFLREQSNIQVLRAEWSFLNQPQRLQAMAARLDELQPIAPEQIGDLAELPLRPEPAGRLEGIGPEMVAGVPRPAFKPPADLVLISGEGRQ